MIAVCFHTINSQYHSLHHSLSTQKLLARLLCNKQLEYFWSQIDNLRNSQSYTSNETLLFNKFLSSLKIVKNLMTRNKIQIMMVKSNSPQKNPNQNNELCQHRININVKKLSNIYILIVKIKVLKSLGIQIYTKALLKLFY